MIRIVVDYLMCLRVPEEDTRLARATTPYICPACKREGFQVGRLHFDGDPLPVCDQHKDYDGTIIRVAMLPSPQFGGSSKVALAG